MKKIGLIIISLLVSFSAFALKLPEGTEARVKNIQLDDNGILAAVLLSEPVEVETSVGKVEATGCILFNDSGKIKELTVNKDSIVETPMGSLPVKGKTVLKFYDSGCIESAYLSNITAFSIKGAVYSAKPGKITFHERWKVNEITLSKDITLQLPCGIIPLKAESNISFSPRGALKQVVLERPVTLKTKNGSFKASGTLILHENGIAQEATADSSEVLQTMYGPIYPVPKSQLEFYSDGQIKSVIPQDVSFVNTKNHNYYIAAEKKIQYFKSGILREAYITGYTAKIYGWTIKFASDLNRVVFYPKYKAYLPGSKVISAKKAKSFKNFELSDKNGILERKLVILPTEFFFWNEDETIKPAVHTIDSDKGQDFVIREINAAYPCDFDENQNFYYKKPPLIFNDYNELIGYRFYSEAVSGQKDGTLQIKEIIFSKKPVRKAETEETAEPVVIPEPYQEEEDNTETVSAVEKSEAESASENEKAAEESKTVSVFDAEKDVEPEYSAGKVTEYPVEETEPETETAAIVETAEETAEENIADTAETVLSEKTSENAEESSENQIEPFPDYLLPENSQKKNLSDALTEEELRAVKKFERDTVSPDLYVEEDEETAAELAAANEISTEVKDNTTSAEEKSSPETEVIYSKQLNKSANAK